MNIDTHLGMGLQFLVYWITRRILAIVDSHSRISSPLTKWPRWSKEEDPLSNRSVIYSPLNNPQCFGEYRYPLPMGWPYYKQNLWVYPVLKVVGVVLYVVHSNLWKRQMEHWPLCIQVRNSLSSLCKLLGKALYTGKRSMAIVTFHSHNLGVDRQTDRHTHTE